MDECKSDISDCDVNANCTNTYGSYKCKCKAGYTGDGHSCSGTYTSIFKDDLIYFASSGCFSYFFCQSSRNNDYRNEVVMILLMY